MGGEGGVEERAVGGREARTLGFQREPVVEDLWVAPGPEQDYVNVVLPAFIGFKVRPLGEVGTELKGNHLPLKTFGSGNIFSTRTWWSPKTKRVHVSMMAMQRKKTRKMMTTVTAAMTAFPFSMSSSRYSPSLNLSLSLSVTWRRLWFPH